MRERKPGIKETVGRIFAGGTIVLATTFGMPSAKPLNENPNKPKTKYLDKYQTKIPNFIFNWVKDNLPGKVLDMLIPDVRTEEEQKRTVEEYFTSRDKKLEGPVEKTIQNQITSVLKEEGFRVFPPVLIKFWDRFATAVVSPKDKIEIKDRKILYGGLSDEEKDLLEKEVESIAKGGVEKNDAYVVENGGMGFVLPVPIERGVQLPDSIKEGLEEWVHQYLALKKLGILYVLDLMDIQKNYEVLLLNEKLAGIIVEEVGNKVYEKYYPVKEKVVFAKVVQRPVGELDKEMRNLRVKVDKHLAGGEAEKAQVLMEETRLALVAKGYSIRKINNAYFAFYGSYLRGQGAQDEVSEMLLDLREQFSSLDKFVDFVAGMSGIKDLKNAHDIWVLKKAA